MHSFHLVNENQPTTPVCNPEVRAMMKNQPSLFSIQILLSGAALFLLLLQPIPTLASSVLINNPNANSTDFIRRSCRATLYPDLCYNSLSVYASAVQDDPARLARVAISVSLSKARYMARYISNVPRNADYGNDHRAASALRDCFSVFGDAVDQIRDSLKQMKRLGSGGESLQFQMSNVQTWMSAALTNEDTCTDGFEDVSDSVVKRDVCNRVVKVKEVTSNALALVNSYDSNVTTP